MMTNEGEGEDKGMNKWLPEDIQDEKEWLFYNGLRVGRAVLNGAITHVSRRGTDPAGIPWDKTDRQAWGILLRLFYEI